MSSSLRIGLLIAAGAAAQQVPNLREAARLDQAGKCAESEAIYQQALSQPNAAGPALFNNLGNHYLTCRQPDKARLYFDKATRAAPNHLNANLQLARLDIAAAAHASAASRLRKLQPAHPNDFDLLLLLGIATARLGEAPQARQTLEAALRLRPEDLTAMAETGLASAASGDYARAVFLLARAQSRAPKHPAIALALARAAEDAGYYGDAALAYDRYLTLVPTNLEARRDRARIAALSGQQQGIDDLRSYVARQPNDALGHFYLAQAIWKDDAGTALNELAEAIRLDARLAPAHSARAWLLHRLGRSEEALPHLQTAITLRPKDHRALDQLGVLLLALDRARQAEPVLRKAASIAPQDPAVALHLGRVLLELGNETEGQHWLDVHQKTREGRQRDPRRESGMIDLAILDPAGRRTREIERFRTMAASRPDDPLLQLNLAALLLDDGQTEAALREFQALKSMNAGPNIWTQAAARLYDAGLPKAAAPFYSRAGLAPDPPAAALQEALTTRYDKAIAMLRTAGAGGAEFRLTEAVITALRGDTAQALQQLRAIESQWPDWGKPHLVHALLLPPHARTAQLRTAASLGANEDVSRCATLREWVSASCAK